MLWTITYLVLKFLINLRKPNAFESQLFLVQSITINKTSVILFFLPLCLTERIEATPPYEKKQIFKVYKTFGNLATLLSSTHGPFE